MFLHAQLRLGTWNSEMKIDLSETELYDQILAPRQEGRPVWVGGKEFRWDVAGIKIFETDVRAAELPNSTTPLETMAVAMHGRDVTDRYIVGPPGGLPTLTTSRQATDPANVGVVHGRDGQVRDAAFGFLRALGLKPLEWDALRAATGMSTPYTGEVLERLFATAQAVVVLFTPDDLALLHEDLRHPRDPAYESEPTGQPRPNVLFEAGMAFGTHPDRTVLVEVGDIRPISDLAGRHVVRFDDGPSALNQLAQRLATAGCPVDMSGSDWLDLRPWQDLDAVQRRAEDAQPASAAPAEAVYLASASGTLMHRTLGEVEPALLVRVAATAPMRASEHDSSIVDDAVRRQITAAAMAGSGEVVWSPIPPNTPFLATYTTSDDRLAFTVDVSASQISGGGLKVVCDSRTMEEPAQPLSLTDLQGVLDRLVSMCGRLTSAVSTALGLEISEPVRVAGYLKAGPSLDTLINVHPVPGQRHDYGGVRHDALLEEAVWPATPELARAVVDQWLFLFALHSGLIGVDDEIKASLANRSADR